MAEKLFSVYTQYHAACIGTTHTAAHGHSKAAEVLALGCYSINLCFAVVFHGKYPSCKLKNENGKWKIYEALRA